MPLTVELYSKYSHGHLIIDRDNLIATFPAGNESPRELLIAYDTRRAFERAIQPIFSLLGQALAKGDINSPAHHITDHMSEHDKNYLHVHITFKEPLRLEEMLVVYKILKDAFYISNECYVDLTTITTSYFQDLRIDARSVAIENTYRIEKNEKLYQKNLELGLIQKAAPEPYLLHFDNTFERKADAPATAQALTTGEKKDDKEATQKTVKKVNHSTAPRPNAPTRASHRPAVVLKSQKKQSFFSFNKNPSKSTKQGTGKQPWRP